MPLHPDDPSASSPSYVHSSTADLALMQEYADKCAFYSGMPVYITDKMLPSTDARPTEYAVDTYEHDGDTRFWSHPLTVDPDAEVSYAIDQTYITITGITPSRSREMVSPCAVTEGGHLDPCGCAPAPPL